MLRIKSRSSKSKNAHHPFLVIPKKEAAPADHHLTILEIKRKNITQKVSPHIESEAKLYLRVSDDASKMEQRPVMISPTADLIIPPIQVERITKETQTELDHEQVFRILEEYQRRVKKLSELEDDGIAEEPECFEDEEEKPITSSSEPLSLSMEKSVSITKALEEDPPIQKGAEPHEFLTQSEWIVRANELRLKSIRQLSLCILNGSQDPERK
jgi:hypothetical protein